MTRATLYLGDCREVMASMPENSVDAIVCDPPYGLSKEPDAAEVLRHWLAGDDYVHSGSGFMGKSWDSFVPGPAVWREAFRVLKPGGHLLAFAGSRTLDLMGIAIRMAGFEIRDTLSYLYGSGFPKSLNVSKAIDKAAGVKGSDAAQAWNGWGTALKPSYEPIVMARKPLIGTVAKNVLEHGTGAINIDACRIGTAEDVPSVKAVRASDYPQSYKGDGQPGWGRSRGGRAGDEVNWSPTAGRWPANTLLSHDEDCVLVGTRKVKSDGHYPSSRPGTTTITTDGHAGQEGLEERYTSGEEVEAWECTEDCPVRLLDEQTGVLASGEATVGAGAGSRQTNAYSGPSTGVAASVYADKGGASRFFYSSKVSKKERNAGLPDLPSLGQAAPMGQTSKVRQCNQCGSRSKSADPSKPHPTCGHDDWSLVEQKGDHKGKVLNDHPTVKPIGVMAWLVKLVTPPGGVVLDPFMGSGSTGCAAAQEGFDFIGCDLDPHYLAIAAYRIQHHGAEQIMAHVVEPSPEPIPEVEAQPESQPAPEPVAEPEPEPEPEPLIEPDEVEVDEDDGPEPVEFDGADANLGPRPKGLAPHPAEWSGAVLGVLGALIPEGVTVLDPMAGTGWRLEEALPGRTLVGVELEPEWAEGASWVQQGDARNLPFADGTFSWVVTSPTYANRMSDSHNAQERCKPCEATGRVGDEICERCDGQGRRAYKRLTYTHRLGRPLSEGSTANLGWIGKEGERYREAHEAIWAEVWRVMAAGGIFLLNVKNHYRTTTKGEPPEEMKVVEWHRDTCLALGFDLIEDYLVKAPGMRFGANRDVRAEHEHVLVLGKPVGPSTSPANG